MKDRTDWKLCLGIFREINSQLGHFEVASRLSAQLPTFVSWRPDPEALATYAFTLDWTHLKGHANPPWNMVGKVLAQA